MINAALLQHRNPYTVRRKSVRSVLWFHTVHEIMYDDTVVYTTMSDQVACDTCVAMNTAHRVGFYDGLSAVVLHSQSV
jgi:hypothetical protein